MGHRLNLRDSSGQGGDADEDLWLSQKMMGILYDVKTHTINYHLKKIFADNELAEESVIQKFRITAEASGMAT